MPDCRTAMTQLDDLSRLKRCVVTKSEMDDEIVQVLKDLLISGRGLEVVSTLVKLATTGSVAKMKVLIGAVAFCTTHVSGLATEDMKVRQAVNSQLQDLCTIATQLFQLLQFESQFSATKQKVGFGRSRRRAVKNWYLSKSPKDLAMTVTKYKRRCHWSHADVLRLAHVKPCSDGVNIVLKYATGGVASVDKYMEELGENADECVKEVFDYLQAVETVKKSQDEHEVARLVEKYRLMREHIPTWMMKSREVWTALLNHMPLLALVKNINHLGSLGLLERSSACLQMVIDKLCNEQHLHDARIHPLNVLLALKAYEKGKRSNSTKTQWQVNAAIVTALDCAFCLSFECIEKTNKRYVLAIDAGQSMQYGGVLGCDLMTPLTASAAMTMLFVRSEPSCQVVAMAGSVKPVDIRCSSSLSDICTAVSEIKSSEERPDCALPMLWAAETKTVVDVFIVFTDQPCSNATTSDDDVATPVKALHQYCETMSCPNTRLVVVTLTTQASPVDLSDANVLYLSGFDASTPEIIRSFAIGDLDSVPAG